MGKPHAKWADDEVTTMIEMLQDATRGNTCDNGFKGPVWQSIADTLTDELKTRSACESKFVRLKKEYKEVHHVMHMSGFGWDHERDLATADEDVSDALLQGRPELRKWKRTPFPWYEQLQEMFGDKLDVGKHSFVPGRQIHSTNASDSDNTLVQIDESAASTPAIGASANSTPSSAFASLGDIAENTELGTQDTAKRRNASEDADRPKRRKTTGVTVMQDMSAGLHAVATAMKRNTTIMSQAVNEDVQSTIEGQAQSQVQEEDCLTDEGIIVMVDLLADSAMARTYMVFRKPAMRKAWIRTQLQKYEEQHTGIFWDWFIDSADGALF